MQWVKIDEVLFFQEGPGVRNTQYTSAGVKLLNVANLVDGKVDLSTSDRYISEEEAYGKYKHFLCDEGDFIVASSGIKVEYIDKKMGFVDKTMLPLCMNTSTIRFKVLNPETLRIRYFMYYLKSQHFKAQLANHITGSAQLNYGPSHLKKMVMPLLPLEMQDEIVEKLDRIQRAIGIREQQLVKLDELVKSRFVEMFGDPVSNPMAWPLVKLGRRCKIVTGNTPSRAEPENYGHFIEWIKSDNINTPCIYLTEAEEYLSEIGFQKCRFVEAGSLLMTCIAGSVSCIGNVGVTNRRVAFNQQINAIVPTEDEVLFLYWLMQLSKPAIHGTINKSIKGILSKGQLSDTEFPFPPRALQEQFATFAVQTDKSKLAVQQALEKLETLKKSLMQQYFGV